MPRRAKGLTAAFVEKGTKPGRYGDGAGLYLLVRSREAKFWLFRYTRGGRMREMGLGPAVGRAAVSLAVAREKAGELRAIVRAGRDPLAERDEEAAKAEADAARAKAAAVTFAACADLYVGAHEASWRNPKHRAQWRSTLATYVLPVLGPLPVGEVDTGAVVQIIEPLWRTRTETASRLRGRIEAVLDYAKARGWREGENPARWRGHLDNLLPQRAKVARVEHHAALRWREIGGFMERLRQCSGIGARALEFAILTATRSGEVRGAMWLEIDLDHAVWTIPAERMKAGREHRVPLSEAALAILHEIAALKNGSGLVFLGQRRGVPMSDMTLTAVLRRMGKGDLTAHGFRSTFRDWCAESTNHPRELAEAALAHTLRDKVEAAYQRGDLLAKRRRLMDDWAAFCAKPMVVGDVVPFGARRSGGIRITTGG